MLHSVVFVIKCKQFRSFFSLKLIISRSSLSASAGSFQRYTTLYLEPSLSGFHILNYYLRKSIHSSRISFLTWILSSRVMVIVNIIFYCEVICILSFWWCSEILVANIMKKMLFYELSEIIRYVLFASLFLVYFFLHLNLSYPSLFYYSFWDLVFFDSFPNTAPSLIKCDSLLVHQFIDIFRIFFTY